LLVVNSSLNFTVGLEQIADRHRAAERSHLVAATRVPRERAPRERSTRPDRVWLGLRRRPKVA
jgi:hypothetical protein